MDFYTHRYEEFKFYLYKKQQGTYESVGALNTVTEGRISWNVFSRILSTARLTIIPDVEIDYLNDRILITREITAGGETEEYSLGMFLAATPGSYGGAAEEKVVQLYDKLLILVQDKIDASYSVQEGENVVDAVKTLILSAGETDIQIEESDHVFSSARVWQAGEDKLTIINDMLSSINYFTLSVDGSGIFRSRKYIAPALRPIPAYGTFYDNEKSIYTADLRLESDYFEVPNKVILKTLDPEDETIVSDTLDRLMPQSPFSYAKRGRWIVRTETVDATSEEVLQGMAERMLLEGVQVIERVNYNHAWVPIAPHDAILFRSLQLGVQSKYTVVSQEISLSPGALVSSTIRRVVSQ